MSIEKGDKTIATDGWLHDSTGDGFCDDYGCVKADDPLRVRVDSEQEARVVLDMAEQHGWVISTNFDHWKLSRINCVSLDRGYVNTYCTNRDTTCRHGVPFSDRRDQVEAYLEYHSEEETMSDDDGQREDDGGLREAIEKGKKDYEEGETTPHEDVFDSGDQPAEDDDELGKWVNRRVNLSDFELSDDEVQNVVEFISKNDDEVDFFSLDKEEANERLDKLIAVEATAGMLNDLSEEEKKRYRKASERRPLFDENDDDGEGDVKRRLAKEILSGDTSLAGAVTVNKLNLYERAIRDHCELSEKGVCEWTHHEGGIYSTDCGERFQFTYDGVQKNGFDGCPFCMRELEITTDGGGFEVGDVVRDTQYQEDDPNTVREYFYIQEVRDYGTEFKYAGEGFELRENEVNDIEKVGSFKPDDDALERVNPDCNGSLFLTDDKVLFDPMCRKEVPDEPIILTGYLDDGTARQVLPPNLEATGIVIDFYEIAEVSNVSTLHVDD